MKIHLQTKRGLNTLKFGACSEILTLFLRGNWKSGYNVFYFLLQQCDSSVNLNRCRLLVTCNFIWSTRYNHQDFKKIYIYIQ